MAARRCRVSSCGAGSSSCSRLALASASTPGALNSGPAVESRRQRLRKLRIVDGEQSLHCPYRRPTSTFSVSRTSTSASRRGPAGSRSRPSLSRRRAARRRSRRGAPIAARRRRSAGRIALRAFPWRAGWYMPRRSDGQVQKMRSCCSTARRLRVGTQASHASVRAGDPPRQPAHSSASPLTPPPAGAPLAPARRRSARRSRAGGASPQRSLSAPRAPARTRAPPARGAARR